MLNIVFVELNYVIFLAIVYCASVVSTIIGFGSALIALPFASMVVDIKKAVGVMAVYYLAVTLSKTISFRKHIDWRISKLMITGNIPGSIAGASLLYYAPPQILKKLLGLIVLAYVLNSVLKFFSEPEVGSRGIVLTGFAYSFFSGLVGTGVALKAPVLLALGLKKEAFTGTHSLTAVVNNSTKLIVYITYGILTLKELNLAAVLAAAGILGVLTGRIFAGRISPDTFRGLVLLMLSLASGKLLLG